LSSLSTQTLTGAELKSESQKSQNRHCFFFKSSETLLRNESGQEEDSTGKISVSQFS